MSKNSRTTLIINELLKQLASGTNVVLQKKRPTLYPYLSSELRNNLPKTKGRELTKLILRYSRQQKLINVEEHPQAQFRLRITDNGVRRVQKITMQELSIPRPSRWDRKWRIVFFDIPETKRQNRNRFTQKLKDLGFYQLQRSIWVHPYPCHIEIEYLKQSFALRPYVCMVEAYKIDRQSVLMNRFRGLVPQKRIS